MIEAQIRASLESWRKEARRFLAQNLSPESIHWTEGEEPTLFRENSLIESKTPAIEIQVPSQFMTLAKFVSCHRDPQRWSLLYRILYRLKNETKSLLSIQTDSDVLKAALMMKSVTKDIHKMHAFVRFKKIEENSGEFYVAWHKPEHFIVAEAAPFFQRRFGDRPWCILTPFKSVSWDMRTLRFSDGVPQHLFEIKDDFDQLWKTYYSSIFNPARLNLKAMKREMSPKYWGSLPETEVVAQLIRTTPMRLQKMADSQKKQAAAPRRNSLAEMTQDLKDCRACPLFAKATQVVCGEGPDKAALMIVGEQPGDQEDLSGKPFVGPAGSILEEILSRIGLDRNSIYFTNAVKHFKFEQQGPLRLHKRASGAEMHACKPWLEAEINHLKPKIIVALGVTAATSLLGRQPKLGQERGQIITLPEKPYIVILSWHPASILRAFDPEEGEQKKRQLAEDLRIAKKFLNQGPSSEIDSD